MNNAFLTIYIPSFRRPKALEQQILSILVQAKALRCDESTLHIIVRLNGYEENCGQLKFLLELESAHKLLKITYNPYNIGGNANIALGFTSANPNGYLWILSDDDWIEADLLQRVLSHLKKENPDLLIIQELHKAECTTIYYADIKDIADCALLSLGLISRGVYSMNYIAQSCEAPFLYHNTSFPHLAIIFSALRKKGKCRLFCMAGQSFQGDACVGHKDHPGNYHLSYAGRLQLIALLPKNAQFRYARSFLSEGSIDLIRAAKEYPDVAYASVSLLTLYAPLLIPLLPYYLSRDLCRRVLSRLTRNQPWLYSQNNIHLNKCQASSQGKKAKIRSVHSDP